MRVIIAGGSGLIGKKLTQELLQHGHSPVILSRNPGRQTNIPDGVQVAAWDGKTNQGWGHLVEDVDAIVNLAGENIAGEKFIPTRWTKKRKQLILQSRLDAGHAITRAVESAGKKPSVVIQSSAIGFYGPLGVEAVDENAPPGNDFLARTCVAWESSTAEGERLGIRHIVIRTGVVLSEKGGALSRLIVPFKFYAGGPLGNGQQVLSWIHIADQVGAIRFLIENPTAHGAYNLTAPYPLTNAAFARTLGKILHRPSFIPVPSFVFKLLFGEVATVVLDGQRVLPKRLLDMGYPFNFVQAGEAVRDLLGKSS